MPVNSGSGEWFLAGGDGGGQHARGLGQLIGADAGLRTLLHQCTYPLLDRVPGGSRGGNGVPQGCYADAARKRVCCHGNRWASAGSQVHHVRSVRPLRYKQRLQFGQLDRQAGLACQL